MKKIIILLSVALATTVYGQKNKDLLAQIDTLTKANTALQTSNDVLHLKADSLQNALTDYMTVYSVVKDSLVKHDFNPAETAMVLDSVKMSNTAQAYQAYQLRLDSVLHINDSLQIENEGLMFTVNFLKGANTVKPVELTDFAGDWNYTLRKVQLVGDGDESGIIDVSSEVLTDKSTLLERYSISSINYIDKEACEIKFSNGEIVKCYYAIVGYSKTQPYYIDFKGIKADFRMYVMNTTSGPIVSYKIKDVDGKYYFGQMIRD